MLRICKKSYIYCTKAVPTYIALYKALYQTITTKHIHTHLTQPHNHKYTQSHVTHTHKTHILQYYINITNLDEEVAFSLIVSRT